MDSDDFPSFSGPGRLLYLSQKKKLADMQSQRELAEKQLIERYKQLETFHGLQEVERRQREQRMMGSLRKETKLLLSTEAERLNAFPSFQYVDKSDLLDNVLSHRAKEYLKSQEENSKTRKRLNEERERLQRAREHLQRSLHYHDDQSPTPSLTSHVIDEGRLGPGEGLPVEGVESIVQKAGEQIQNNIRRCWSLREDLAREYNKKYNPYNNELGRQSYFPWQIEDYTMVRHLVEDFVDGFLDQFFAPDYSKLERGVAKATIESEERKKKEKVHLHSEDKILHLLVEEMVLEVTSEMSTVVVGEMYQLFGLVFNLANNTLMTTAESIVTRRKDGRQRDDPNYQLVTKAYFLHQRDRQQSRAEQWSHTQPLTMKTSPKTIGPTMRADVINLDDEDIAEGVTLIGYDHVTPIDVSLPLVARESNKWRQLHEESYMTKELQYWRGMEPYLFSTGFKKKCRGLSCVKVSLDHRYLAVGTGHGDVIIYGLWTEPWLLVRVMKNTEKTEDAVINISWSLDHTRLITVNRSGGVQLWSMTPWGPPVVKSDLKSMGLTLINDSYLPFPLTLLLSLHHDDKDFSFQKGPLSDRKVLQGDHLPTSASFFPDFTLLGTQNSICISLTNGDILKSNTEEATMISTNENPESGLTDDGTDQSGATSVTTSARFIHKPKEAQSQSVIGQGIVTELLRKHTSSIVLIGYLDNIGQMVSVDDKAYVYMWDYSRKEISGSDWLEPVHRYRLTLHKTMYTTDADAAQHVLFGERDLREKNTPHRDIDQSRKKADQRLQILDLGNPWYVQSLPAQKLKKFIYKPNGLITSSGADFHIVMRRQPSNILYSYFTRLYHPSQVKSSKFVCCTLNPAGREIIFSLLYPETSTKGPHLSLVILCLLTMKVKDLRFDIPLSESVYTEILKRDVVSMEVSRVHSVFGSAYLFVSIVGFLWGFSLLTGQTVLKVEDTDRSDFAGYGINSLSWRQPSHSKITLCNIQGELYILSYAEKHKMLTVLNLVDGNSDDKRRTLMASYKNWGKAKLLPPSERLSHSEFVTEDDVHPEVLARSICLEIINRVIPDKENSPVKNFVMESYLAIVRKIQSRSKRKS